MHTIVYLFYFVKHWETEWENSGTEAHTVKYPMAKSQGLLRGLPHVGFFQAGGC